MTGRIARAMVTGASAGLGLALARGLAGQGVDLVLVARREPRLHALADELPVDVEVVAADLGDPADLARVAARAAATRDPIDLLVNNAGSGAYAAFEVLDEDRLRSMLEVNVTALTCLTRAVLPQLLDRERGGVINVGSTAGYRPCPQAAVYGATKAYVRSFTAAVHDELRDSGVHLMLLAPGSTDTEFQQVAGLRAGGSIAALRASADEVAAAGLRAFAARRAVCVPGVGSRLAVTGSALVPDAVLARVSGVATRRLAVG